MNPFLSEAFDPFPHTKCKLLGLVPISMAVPEKIKPMPYVTQTIEKPVKSL
jgi:hypothetical protein